MCISVSDQMIIYTVIIPSSVGHYVWCLVPSQLHDGSKATLIIDRGDMDMIHYKYSY